MKSYLTDYHIYFNLPVQKVSLNPFAKLLALLNILNLSLMTMSNTVYSRGNLKLKFNFENIFIDD